MGRGGGADGTACLRAVSALVRAAQARGKRGRPCGGDDGVFGGGARGFRGGAVLQARHCGGDNRGNVLRLGRRLHDGGNVRADIQYLVWSGRVDSVPDAVLGAHRLACGSAQPQRQAGKAIGSVPLWRGCGRAVLAGDGFVDGALGGRGVLPRQMACGDARLAADNGGLLRLKRGFPAASEEAARQQAEKAEGQVRGFL